MAKTFETAECEKKDYLKTRYYKTNADLVMSFIEKDLVKRGLVLVSSNREYGEISATASDYEITAKVFQYNATEVAVDLYLYSNFLFDFGKSRRIIEDFYENLNKNFQLIGLALHR